MDMPGFAAMEKIWNKDHEADFDTTDIVFGSHRFCWMILETMHVVLRNAGEVEYYCTTRNLTVVETGDYLTAILDSSMNSTRDVPVYQPEPTNGTVWNVRLGINETLDARDNHTYFLMLFNGNATVHCTLNGEKPSVETTKLNAGIFHEHLFHRSKNPDN
ncbi:hypothetical protein OSTOST_20059 [Ostertagia ostertagi]